MATAGNETRIGGQCRLGRGTREHPSRRRPSSRGVDRVDRHARDHPCVVYARYAVIDDGGCTEGERRYYTGEYRSEKISNDKTYDMERSFIIFFSKSRERISLNNDYWTPSSFPAKIEIVESRIFNYEFGGETLRNVYTDFININRMCSPALHEIKRDRQVYFFTLSSDLRDIDIGWERRFTHSLLSKRLCM